MESNFESYWAARAILFAGRLASGVTRISNKDLRYAIDRLPGLFTLDGITHALTDLPKPIAWRAELRDNVLHFWIEKREGDEEARALLDIDFTKYLERFFPAEQHHLIRIKDAWDDCIFPIEAVRYLYRDYSYAATTEYSLGFVIDSPHEEDIAMGASAILQARYGPSSVKIGVIHERKLD